LFSGREQSQFRWQIVTMFCTVRCKTSDPIKESPFYFILVLFSGLLKFTTCSQLD
jgi:hypothetical protein